MIVYVDTNKLAESFPFSCSYLVSQNCRPILRGEVERASTEYDYRCKPSEIVLLFFPCLAHWLFILDGGCSE